MNSTQFIIFAVVLSLSVMLTRFAPFLLFGGKKGLPPLIGYLGAVLPPAVMGMLVVYCFKDLVITDFRSVLPTLAATATVVGVHLWKKNTILCVIAGTAVYMLLVRFV